VFGAVEGKQGGLAINNGLQVDRTPPNNLDIRQRIRRLVQA
jgi:hypothetical protein